MPRPYASEFRWRTARDVDPHLRRARTTNAADHRHAGSYSETNDGGRPRKGSSERVHDLRMRGMSVLVTSPLAWKFLGFRQNLEFASVS